MHLIMAHEPLPDHYGADPPRIHHAAADNDRARFDVAGIGSNIIRRGCR